MATTSQDVDLSKLGINDGHGASNAPSKLGIIDNVTNGGAAAPMPQVSMVGMLYRHDCRYCGSRWSEFANLDEEHAHLGKKIAHIPIIHRHTYEDKHWVTSSFTIHNDAMKDILSRALDKYRDLDMELENWMFRPPYRPIVHRWDRLKELQANTTNTLSKQVADTLMKFLEPILATSVDALSQTRRTGKISFEAVWQIFPPGELVLTKFFGVDTICRVLKYERQEVERTSFWIITTEYVDWNGENCGYTTTKTTIVEFDGFRRVTALPVYPLSFNSAAADIRSEMIERGRRFERLRGYHFLACSGKKVLLENSEERPEEKPVSGRVVIDAFAYYRSCNIVKPDLRSLFDDGEKITKPLSRKNSILEGPEQMAAAMNEQVSRCEDLRSLNDQHCLLATPWLKGMDLKTKEWGQFHIDDLTDVKWNDGAFENLVLPGGEKELAWAFVDNKNMSNYTYDDFIPEKGRGIIILMFGPPGVGKTYTAEAVAEKSRVPLYSISAGVLGTKPKEVEQSLDRALELCRLWNAMLLLDEADVFLGARTNDALSRNELVSIFLTKLEYYQGILFLTTNRISSIDHAFQSRVDLFLPYSNLTTNAREKVWENFMNHVGREKFDISQTDLEKLSKVSLNGREIKNLIKSAQLLSFKSGEKVSMGRLYMLAEKRVKALELLVD